MSHRRTTCRYCRRTDEAHRLARFNARVTAHPDCWLAQGGDIAGLSDQTIMMFSRRTCIRLGMIDEGAGEYAELREQERRTASILAALAGRAKDRPTPAEARAAAIRVATALRQAAARRDAARRDTAGGNTGPAAASSRERRRAA